MLTYTGLLRPRSRPRAVATMVQLEVPTIIAIIVSPLVNRAN
jgi:hypothetical protein